MQVVTSRTFLDGLTFSTVAQFRCAEYSKKVLAICASTQLVSTGYRPRSRKSELKAKSSNYIQAVRWPHCSSEQSESKTVSVVPAIWHRRFGHLGINSLQKLARTVGK